MTAVSPDAFPARRFSLNGWRSRNVNKINAAVGASVFVVISLLILKDMPPVRFRLDATPFLAAPAMVKAHVVSAVTAFFTGLILLAGVKGNLMHRTLGYGWVVAMAATAISSFMLFGPVGSYLSLIHALSAWTLIGLPMGIAAARGGRIRAHARHMTGMFTGGMLIAGLFTFLPCRLMWDLLFTV